MATTTANQSEPLTDAATAWMTFPAARRFLGIGARAFGRLVVDGLLTVRDVPGSHPKALRKDVEELARQCTRVGELPAPGPALDPATEPTNPHEETAS